MKRISWAVVFTLVALGCVERPRELSAAEREQLSGFLRTEPTAPQHRLDAKFGDKLRLVGYDLDKSTLEPGGSLRITWHWAVDGELDEGWRLFTHVADATGTDRINQDTIGVVRQLYPPSRWKKGQYVLDVQDVVLPDDWTSARATFFVGVWRGPNRLEVKSGPNDGDNRVRALSIPTPQGSRKSQVPELRVPRAQGEIVLDGKLDEPAWKLAPIAGPFVNTVTGAPAEPTAQARVLWDDQHLYVAFEVADTFLRSTFRNFDDHLWEQDAVEIMLDPHGQGRNYFEMQVSPAGVVFDTRYDRRRDPGPIGHADWNSELRAGVQVRGKLNDGKADAGYTVEIAIPFAAFDTGPLPAKPPASGTTFRGNFYVLDATPQGQRGVGWSAVKVPDFHTPARFGKLIFVGAEDGEIGEPSVQEAPTDAPRVSPEMAEKLRSARKTLLKEQTPKRAAPAAPK